MQCSVPEIPNATAQGGTTFGEHCNVKCEVEYTVTELGGDERIQTMECMENGVVQQLEAVQARKLWRSAKGGFR